MYGMMYQTVRFEEVSRWAEKTVKCAKCGKKIRRQRTFSQSINPWNKTADGRVKRRDDIIAELGAEIEKWKAEPELCRKCESTEGGD